MSDETAGFPSRTLGYDPILGVGVRTSNQFLKGNSHTGESGQSGPHSNRIDARRRPRIAPAPIGKPNASSPLGKGWPESMDEG
jgi:hypothetical protein